MNFEKYLFSMVIVWINKYFLEKKCYRKSLKKQRLNIGVIYR